jgi:hypothetical protein
VQRDPHRDTGDGPRAAFDTRFDAAFQPGYQDDLDLRVLELGDDLDVPEPAPLYRPLVDRFVVAIWLVGALLVIVPLIVIAVLAGDRTNLTGSDPAAFVVYSLLSSLTPFVLAVGLATLVGSLFLLAHRWERRP